MLFPLLRVFYARRGRGCNKPIFLILENPTTVERAWRELLHACAHKRIRSELRGAFFPGGVQLLMRAGARVVLCMRVSRWSMRERVELACGLRAAQQGSADVRPWR